MTILRSVSISNSIVALSIALLLSCAAQTALAQRAANGQGRGNVFGVDPIPTIHLTRSGEIGAVSGEMEGRSSREQIERIQDSIRYPHGHSEDHVPWRHHVDFDELHPGEDLIAEETGQPNFDEFRPFEILTDDSFIGGRNLPPPPVLTNESSEEQINHEDAMTRMMTMLSTLSSNSDPWWKGANVCVKREEEDRAVDWNDDDDSSEEMAPQRPQRSRDRSSGSDQSGFHLKFASCQDLEMKHSCVTHLIGPNVNKTIRTDYECCAGYLLNSERKCQRGTLKSIATTMAEIGGKEFSRLIHRVGLDAKLESENLTIFMPSDDAIAMFMGGAATSIDSNEISVSLSQDEEIERRRRSALNSPSGSGGRRRIVREPNRRQTSSASSRQPDANSVDANAEDWRQNALEQQNSWRAANNRRTSGAGLAGRQRQTAAQVTYSHPDNSQELQQTLLAHMSKGKMSTDDFEDEKVIFGESSGSKGALRLNTWTVGTKKIKTVNCARLISVNHQCTNGMIHLVDRMFKPVTKTIADVVTSSPELTSLKALLSVSGHLRQFRDSNEHLTLFAPTNSALEKLGPAMLHKLRNGDPCLKRIIQNHVLPFTLCSTIIYDQGQIRNSAHGTLEIERTSDDKLFVNGSQIITKDIVTTNGVVHIIDAVMLSPNDKPVASALERAGLTSFLELMTQVGLKNYLDEISNVTVFAPSNAALQQLPREVRENPTRLRDILMYHIGGIEMRACHMGHGQKIPTKFNDLPIRIDLYSLFPFVETTQVTAQCGRLTKVNTPACNGLIHTVDRVLIPPQTNVIQTLTTQPDFSILTRLIKETNLTETLTAEGPFTIFAPTDSAFYALPREVLENILNDRAVGLRVLKKHILAESFCCSGVSPNNWFLTKRVKTLAGTLVPVQRDFAGQIMFGNTKVSVCDLTASNGVIHTVDSLLGQEMEENEHAHEFMGSCLPKVKDVHSTMFFGF